MFFFHVLEELRKMTKKQQDMYALGDFLQMSKGGEAYFWLCANLLKCVVGCTKWSRSHYKDSLSEIATDSDECFLLLIVENNYARWIEEAKMDEDDSRDKLPATLYTSGGGTRGVGGASSKRFLGWTKEGYKCFNALHTMVKNDRMQRVGFEIRLKERLEEDNANRNRGVESSDEDEEEEIVPANDFVGVRQPVAPIMASREQPDQDSDSSSDDDDDNEDSGFLKNN